MPRPAFALAAAVLVIARTAFCADLLPADRTIAEVVDHYIDAGLKTAAVKPAAAADDATLIRRLTLDLAGRIPTAAESRAYVASTDPDKRARLVDRLMASPGFVRHQATELDTHAHGRQPRGACATTWSRPSARIGPGTGSFAS